MPIEVPDTRAFSEPPRRGRATAKPPADSAVAAPADVAPEPESAFRKPVRRRKPVAAEVIAEPAAPAVAVVEVAAAPEPSSAFSRPVRRRPKAAAAPVPSEVLESPVSVGPVAPSAPATPAAPPIAAAPAAAPVAAAPVAGGLVAAAAAAAAPPAVAPAAPPVAIPAQAHPSPTRVEERRGTEGVVEAVVQLTDTVVVRLAGTRYAVSMDAVAEVGRPPHVTRVPGVPAWMAGVANWRGRIMPVLDLRVLLGASTPELGITGRIMVLARDGVTLAFLAERVEGVVSLELDSLEPVLVTLSRTTASVIAGQLTHPDGPIAVLDLEMLFGLRSQLPRVRRAG